MTNDTQLYPTPIYKRLQRLIGFDISADTVKWLNRDIDKIGAGLYEATQIIEWNMDRGCHLNVSYKLERTMLTSEIREAYASETIVDLVDAVADIIFVAVGTWSKLMYTTINSSVHPVYAHSMLKCSEYSLDNVAIRSYAPIITYAKDELLYRMGKWSSDENDYGIVKDIIGNAINIVIEANNLKPKERDSNGKIIKGDKWVAPEPRLREMLINYGVDVDTPLRWDYRWLT